MPGAQHCPSCARLATPCCPKRPSPCGWVACLQCGIRVRTRDGKWITLGAQIPRTPNP